MELTRAGYKTVQETVVPFLQTCRHTVEHSCLMVPLLQVWVLAPCRNSRLSGNRLCQSFTWNAHCTSRFVLNASAFPTREETMSLAW